MSVINASNFSPILLTQYYWELKSDCSEMLGCVVATLFPQTLEVEAEKLGRNFKRVNNPGHSCTSHVLLLTMIMPMTLLSQTTNPEIHHIATTVLTPLPNGILSFPSSILSLSELWTQKLCLYVVCYNACYSHILLIVYQCLLVDGIYCPHHTKPKFDECQAEINLTELLLSDWTRASLQESYLWIHSAIMETDCPVQLV